MLDPRPEVLDFLLTRRSRPAKTLAAPYPTKDELQPILLAAARTPDHGKLEPWRFVVLQDDALKRLENLTIARCNDLGFDSFKSEKTSKQFADAGLIVVVIASPKPSEKVPEFEQLLSAGAVCLALLNAGLASGWGANWLTGPMAEDRQFMSEGLNLEQHELVAGFMHLGTERAAPPERPRPDIATIVEWVSE